MLMIKKHIEDFKKYLANERRYPETTINSYDYDLSNKYVTFLNKHPEINYKTITKDEIRILLKEEKEYNSSKSSTSRMLSALRHFYRYLEIHKIVANNPLKILKILKKIKEYLIFFNIMN